MRLNPAVTARMRRHALAGVAALAMVLTLAACERAPAPAASAPSSAGASATASVPGFPVTLRSALGEAVIPAPPRRVVTLGLGADDLALALGVVPVGVGRADWGGDPEHYWPWVRAAIEARGQALPERITVYPELDIEKIIACLLYTSRCV